MTVEYLGRFWVSVCQQVATPKTKTGNSQTYLDARGCVLNECGIISPQLPRFLARNKKECQRSDKSFCPFNIKSESVMSGHSTNPPNLPKPVVNNGSGCQQVAVPLKVEHLSPHYSISCKGVGNYRHAISARRSVEQIKRIHQLASGGTCVRQQNRCGSLMQVQASLMRSRWSLQ